MSVVMPPGLRQAAAVLCVWAKKKPCIKRIYFYGSLVEGRFHEENNLDIAIELDELFGETDPMTTFICNAGQWRAELKVRTPFQLHIKLLEGDNTPAVTTEVENAGILIYVRP